MTQTAPEFVLLAREMWAEKKTEEAKKEESERKISRNHLEEALMYMLGDAAHEVITDGFWTTINNNTYHNLEALRFQDYLFLPSRGHFCKAPTSFRFAMMFDDDRATTRMTDVHGIIALAMAIEDAESHIESETKRLAEVRQRDEERRTEAEGVGLIRTLLVNAKQGESYLQPLEKAFINLMLAFEQHAMYQEVDYDDYDED